MKYVRPTHLTLALAFHMSATSIAAQAPLGEIRVSNFEMFVLRPGPNAIRVLTPDGRNGLIVSAWRDNGNAHGFNVFMVLAPATRGGNDYNVAVFGADGGWVPGQESSSISDTPHVDEDYVRSVRFGRADLAGRRETLAFVATRNIVESYPAPATTRIQLLALRNRGDEALGPLDYFEVVADYVTTRRYCNSDAALWSELGVPLPSNYQGADSATGCF